MDLGFAYLDGMGLQTAGAIALKKLLHESLAVWIQPTCLKCGCPSPSGILCQPCNSFREIHPPWCQHCGTPISHDRCYCGDCERKRKLFLWTRSLFWLDDGAQQILHEIKFLSHFPTLRFLLQTQLRRVSLPALAKETWIIPVPLSARSLGERGFNQSELLAQSLGKRLEKNVIPDALAKIRNTDRQSWLNTRERQKNLKDAFRWNQKYQAPESVLLVDDVYTTGSTLRECASVLKRVGVKDIQSWTLFRTPKRAG